MKKEVKLVNKIKRLLRRLGCPRWLHHYGPKKYELCHHILALLVRHYCKCLSYRAVVRLLDALDIKCPSKSALQYTMQKMKASLWEKILTITSGGKHYLAAIDSTGLSRTNPSYHYLRRIDGKMPKIPVKLSFAFDTKKKKFCAAKIRVLPAHDIKDAYYLLEKSEPEIAVADKGYSAENLYKQAYYQKTLLMVPLKKNAKRGFYRKKMCKKFRTRTYHRRELAETGVSCIKRKFGHSVSSKNAKTIRAECYARLICHNLFYCFEGLLGQSRSPI